MKKGIIIASLIIFLYVWFLFYPFVDFMSGG